MSREPSLREWLPDQVYGSLEETLGVLGFLIRNTGEDGNPVRAPFVLGVELRTTGALVGHVGLSPLRGSVEVGYAIGAEHQGGGYASEAVRAMTDWGLERFGLPEILGVVSLENAASCRVLEKSGFVLASESEGSLHGRAGVVRTYRKGMR